MEINYAAILVATSVQFLISGVWYMVLFSDVWGKIHGFDALAPENQKQAQKDMRPFLLAQCILTLLTSFVFALLLSGFPPEWNLYGIAGLYWLGFVMPAQASAVLFGGTKPGFVITKIAVSAGASLASYLALAVVFSLMA